MLHRVFLSVLSSSADLSPDVLRSALVCAQESRSEELMKALASRPDLPDDVDEAIRKENRAPVRAAWITRPGRSVKEVQSVLAKEKRATVLSAVVLSGSAPAEVVISAASDQRASVACAVLESPAPRDVREVALRNLLAKYDDLTNAQRSTLDQAVLSGAVLAPEESIPLTSGHLLRSLVKTAEKLTPASYLHALQTLVEDACAAVMKQKGAMSSYHRSWVIDKAYMDAVSLLEKAPDDACIEATRVALAPYQSSRSRLLEDALKLVSSGLNARQALLSEAKDVETTPVRLSELTASALQNNDSELATHLVQNLSTPADSFSLLISTTSPAAALAASISRGDCSLASAVISGTYFNDMDALASALEVFGPALVKSLGGDLRIERLVSERPALQHLADTYVASTPLRELARFGSGSADPVIAAAVCRQLSELSPETFRFASALQVGWEGTLEDLVEACKAVSS